MKYYFFSPELLPDGFLFPRTYIDFLMSAVQLPDLTPWWFLCAFRESADFWLLELQHQYPTRKLVPFAKMDFSDDVACFDASVLSADPKVH